MRQQPRLWLYLMNWEEEPLPRRAFCIAYAVLEFITLKIKSITLFATHYKDLCEMSKDYKEIKNKTLEIKKWEEEIIFHYKVIDGISEGSFGIHVANLAGVNKSIISTARKVLEKINKFEIDFEIEKNIEFNTDNDRANEISKFIKKLDLDNLSPKESLDILYTLKKLLFRVMKNTSDYFIKKISLEKENLRKEIKT